MKKIAYVIILPLISTSIISFMYLRYLEANKDKTAPVIEVLEDNLVFFESDDFNYLDYVKAYDETSDVTLRVKEAYLSKLKGKRQIEIEAKDETGNTASAFINVNIISDSDWNKFISENTYNYIYRRSENKEFAKLKGNADYDAFNLALEFVGMKGGCNEIAQAFVNTYFNKELNIYDTYEVSYEEAKPGDIIYYANGGAGLQHYAVYLGGSSALQGNINGTTVIGSVYMMYGSTPYFYRLNGLE